ncbi:membrane-spanning 4-domains subfamily A member 4D-like [Rana temporaria]|uniref:membrane-spanning 4-domains subfamily A member 4D-like n=1 Tax=Rana temporaria TaxID=8407 RepID=UPI001AAC7E25|nr:membrane-spanning 4-domains subfamily A member 4D-like [Rana temporaria]
MMSDPASEGAPHTYESLLSGNPSAAPASNVPAPSYFQNVNPQPPMHPTPQIWSVPTIIPQNRDPSSPFFQKFLKGKPKVLGSLVIVAAILEIGLGIALVFTVFGFTLISGIPFWGPVFYIIAGSLTLAAQTKPNICLIKGSLTLNIISSIFSMIAVILNIADLATLRCYIYSYSYYSYYSYNEALKQCQQALDGGFAVLSLLLLMNLLIFCVTVSTSVFDCRSLSKVQSGQPVTQVFVIQNDAVHAMYPGALPVPVTTTYAQPPPAQPPAYPANLYKP